MLLDDTPAGEGVAIPAIMLGEIGADFDLVPGFDKPKLPMAIVAGLADDGSIKVTVTNPLASADALPGSTKINVEVYARPADALDDSQDVLLNAKEATISVSDLKPDKSKSTTVKLAFPADLPEGNYVIVAKIDTGDVVAENDENNNELVLEDVTITVADPFVDLEAAIGAKIKLPQEQIISGDGDKLKVPVEILNRGNVATANGQTVAVTLTAVPDGGGDEIELETFTVKISNLKPGKTKKATLTVQLPPGVEAGMYRIRADIDSGDEVDESDEMNNAALTGQIDVALGVVDLRGEVSGKSKLPTAVVNDAGTEIDLKVDIFNDGNVDVPKGQEISIEVYARPVGGGPDVLLKTFDEVSISGLKAGKSKSVTLKDLVFPEDELGEYDLVAIIDSNDDLNESDEDNNEAVSDAFDAITVAEPFVDLSVEIGDKLAMAEQVTSGDGTKFKVPIEITNLGNVAAESGQMVDIIIQAVATAGGGGAAEPIDLEATFRESIGKLNPGKTKKVNLAFTLPPGVPDGTYEFRVTVDPAQEIDDPDTDNNVAVTPMTVQVGEGFVDLAGEVDDDFELPQGLIAGEGETFDLPVTLTNLGNVDMPDDTTITITVFARPDAGGDDVLLATFNDIDLGGLEPGDDESLDLDDLTIPEGLSGAYRLVVVIDAGNHLAESDEDNNELVTDPFDVETSMMDLTVAVDGAFNPGAQVAGDGTLIDLPIEITNLGNTAVPGGQTIDVTVVARLVGGGADVELAVFSDLDVGGLEPDDTIDFTLEGLTLPLGLNGTYRLRAVIDSGNDLAEGNENNNHAGSVTFEVQSSYADLTVAADEAFTPPALILAGDGSMFTLPITITNLGNAALAGDQTIDVVVAASPVAGGQPVQLAMFEGLDVGGLGAGADVTFDLEGLSIPAGLIGQYQLMVIVDAGQDVVESDENNNIVLTDADAPIAVVTDLLTLLGFDQVDTAIDFVGTRAGDNIAAGDAAGTIAVLDGGGDDLFEVDLTAEPAVMGDDEGEQTALLLQRGEQDIALDRHLVHINDIRVDVVPDAGLLVAPGATLPLGELVEDESTATMNVQATLNDQDLDFTILNVASQISVELVGYETVELANGLTFDTAKITVTITHVAAGTIDVDGQMVQAAVAVETTITFWADQFGIVQYLLTSQTDIEVDTIGVLSERSEQTMALDVDFM